MSNEDAILNEMFEKAIKDAAFRKRLFNDPNTILESYNLSESLKKYIITICTRKDF